VTLLLLVLPAVGFTCELASALCGPEGSVESGVEAPPCHGMPNPGMECCSVQAPVEQPAAATLRGTELQWATLSLAPQKTLSLGLAAASEPCRALPEPCASPGRHALLSVYLL
jgi:hypothetical protein